MGVTQTLSISVVYSCKKKMGIFPLISILTILNTEELQLDILYSHYVRGAVFYRDMLVPLFWQKRQCEWQHIGIICTCSKVE